MLCPYVHQSEASLAESASANMLKNLRHRFINVDETWLSEASTGQLWNMLNEKSHVRCAEDNT